MNKRKQWIINKDFQYKFILMTVLPGAIVLLIFWLGIEFIFYRMILMGEELGVPKGHVFFSLLKSQKNLFNLVMLSVSLGTICIFGIWSIFFSNKIAGPLYRLTQFLRELNRDTKGSFPKVKFRDGDFFLEVSEEMNAFLERESDKQSRE